MSNNYRTFLNAVAEIRPHADMAAFALTEAQGLLIALAQEIVSGDVPEGLKSIRGMREDLEHLEGFLMAGGLVKPVPAPKAPSIRPNRKWAAKLAGTMDWYLVASPKGKQIPVREADLAGRKPLAGPYETKSQALCERTN